MVNQLFMVGSALLLAMTMIGAAGASAGSEAQPTLPLAGLPLTSLENLRLLERSAFEPSPEIWTRIAGSSDVTTHLGLLARGALALEAGAVDDARRSFEAARAANGGSPYPYYYLARIEIERGNPAGAIKHLRESVRRRRDFAASYRLLGHAFIEQGATRRGFTALRTVIALAPGLAEPHLELGRAYLDHGRPAHAVIELQRAVELSVNPLESLYLLGRAELNAGMIEEGFADLEAYVVAAAGLPTEQERLSHARLLLKRFAGGPI